LFEQDTVGYLESQLAEANQRSAGADAENVQLQQQLAAQQGQIERLGALLATTELELDQRKNELGAMGEETLSMSRKYDDKVSPFKLYCL
jgi:uncharacterized coiled-coil protein SlyX